MDYCMVFQKSSTPTIIIDTDQHTAIYKNPAADSFFQEQCSFFTAENLLQHICAIQKTTHSSSAPENLFQDSLPQTEIEIIPGHFLLISGNPVLLTDQSHFAVYIQNLHKRQAIKANQFLQEIFQIVYSDDSLSRKINKILYQLGDAISVDRTLLFEGEEFNSYFENIYEWHNSETTSMQQYLQKLDNRASLWRNVSRIPGAITTFHIEKAPSSQKNLLKSFDINSLLVIPMIAEKRLFGFLSLHSRINHKNWSEDERLLLHYAAVILSLFMAIKQEQKNAKNSYNMMHMVLDNINLSIYVSDIKTYKILFANKTFATRYGYEDPRSLENRICWEIVQNGRGSPCSFCPIEHLFDSEGHPLDIVKSEMQNPIDNEWYYLEDSIIPWINGQLVHMGTSMDFSEHKKREERLEYIASTDTRTGLWNNEWGKKLLVRELERIYRENSFMSVCFIDIDELKYVNDTYGHESGDFLIISIVEAIRSHIRKNDIFCRWAGDEFVLVLNQCRENRTNEMLAKAKQSLQEINESQKYPFPFSFSAGVQEVHHDSNMSAEEIIRTADSKMYIEKTSKKQVKNIIFSKDESDVH